MRLNQMWRNGCINDTYEPGSTFKIITASAGLEEGVVELDDTFTCPGLPDRGGPEDPLPQSGRPRRGDLCGGDHRIPAIRCSSMWGCAWERTNFYEYFQQFGLMRTTGVDLPGEAGTIMHKKENMGPVELATMSFGQSFQITPIQMAATVSSLDQRRHPGDAPFGRAGPGRRRERS